MLHAISRAKALKNVQRYQGLVGLLLLFITAFFLSKDFFQVDNGLNILKQLAIPGSLAIGMTYVILTGGIDLSVGSHLALLNVIAATWLKHGASVPATFAYVLSIGTLIGALIGWIVGKTKLQPFVVTLAAMVSLRGIAYVYSNRSMISGLKDALAFLQNPFLGLPLSGWILILLTVGTAATLIFTVFGRHIYAIGGNAEASRLSGVPVNLTRTGAYAINGFCVGVAALLYTARTNNGAPSSGLGFELDAIAAVVVGGASLAGGMGSAFGSFIGALFMVCVNNILQLRGVDTNIAQGWTGLIILAAVYAQSIGSRSRSLGGT
jgi:ribose transport system permease protein